MSNQNVISLITFKKYRVWIALWKLCVAVSIWLLLDNPNPGSFKMEETWEDIPEFEGLYQISNYGRARSLKRQSLMYQYMAKKKVLRWCGGKIMKPNITREGYPTIQFCNYVRSRRFSIHRIVAQVFIPNPENKPCVNHKDGNKLNNNVSNLEWCTHSENQKHAFYSGLKKLKLSPFQVRVIRKTTDLTEQELADIFDVTKRNINHIKNHDTWEL